MTNATKVKKTWMVRISGTILIKLTTYSLQNAKLSFQHRILIQSGDLTAPPLTSKDEVTAGPHITGTSRWKLTLKSKQGSIEDEYLIRKFANDL